MVIKSSDKQPVGKTRNGNKLFTGIEDAKGKGFTSTNQPTPEQKSAGWAKKKARDEFIERIYGKMNALSKRDDLTNREIIDLAKIAIEISGDKKETRDLNGNLAVKEVYITAEEDKATDQHIDDVINGRT